MVDLLNEMRCYESTHKMLSSIMGECGLRHDFYNTDNSLNEGDDANNEERQKILDMINNGDYDVNDYKTFLEDLPQNKRSQFLSTYYTEEDFANNNVRTYRVKGYPIGFALKPDTEGGNGVDIISVHNNTNIGGIGDALIQSAKRLGGNMLDHYDGFLSDFYQKHGFEEYERYPWDDQYAAEDWDYDTYGRPDVVMRRLYNNG